MLTHSLTLGINVSVLPLVGLHQPYTIGEGNLKPSDYCQINSTFLIRIGKVVALYLRIHNIAQCFYDMLIKLNSYSYN